MLTLACLVAAATTLATGGVAATAVATEAVTVPRQDAPADRWDGFQFLAADKKGVVYLLRPDTLEIFTLEPGSRPAPAGVLKPREPLHGKVVEAVMSSDGDRWLLRTTARQLPLFEDGREVRRLTPPDWQPEGFAFSGDTPVALVLPTAVGFSPRSAELDDDPPWVLQMEDWGWETLIDPTLPPELDLGDYNRVRLERAGPLAMGARSLWIGRWYAYRVDRYSPGGTHEMRLEVGPEGAPKKIGDEDLEAAREALAALVEADTEAAGREPVVVEVADRVEAFAAISEARDGRLYLLVQEGYAGGGRVRLDRFDPVALRLESIALAIEAAGRSRLAAGRHGLWVAAPQASNGRWFLSWEALDEAPWESIEAATLNGFPLHGPQGDPPAVVHEPLPATSD